MVADVMLMADVMPRDMEWTKTHRFGLILSLLVLGGLYAAYTIYGVPGVQNRATTYDALIQSSEPFARGMQLYQAGSYGEAQAVLEQAYLEARDDDERGQIDIKIAHAVRMNGNHMAAIPLYKDIALNASYSGMVRAYAIDALSTIYATYADPAITQAIFSTEPFREMYRADDVPGSYARLHAYGSSFYKLATIESRLADFYAGQLLRTHEGLSPIEIGALKDSIRASMAAIDADVERIAGIPNESSGIPAIVMRKAMVAGKMAQLGDSSFGDPDALFQQAIELAEVKGSTTLGYARLNYAFYLHEAGESRTEEVRALLRLLSDTTISGHKLVTAYFTSVRTGDAAPRARVVALASVSPEFKAHLMSLGWKDSDFTL